MSVKTNNDTWFSVLNRCKTFNLIGQWAVHDIVLQKMIKACFNISPQKVPGKQLTPVMVTVYFCHFVLNVFFN